MSRRVNPISIRLYNQRLWSHMYTARNLKQSDLFHQTSFIDLYIRSKILQIKSFYKKQSRKGVKFKV